MQQRISSCQWVIPITQDHQGHAKALLLTSGRKLTLRQSFGEYSKMAVAVNAATAPSKPANEIASPKAGTDSLEYWLRPANH